MTPPPDAPGPAVAGGCLTASAKGRFPFPVACPSFVYRAGYGENVRRLAPWVDEIQLLFFESRPADHLPSRRLVRELADLARRGQITYQVHLPTDIDPGHREPTERRRAVEVLKTTIDRCAPLQPTTFTLHLAGDPAEPDPARWLAHAAQGLERVLALGLPGRRISVENLTDDLAPLASLIAALDLSVCMDMGHLMVRGMPLGDFFERWRERIAAIHLHGVVPPGDHLPLDRLAPARLAEVAGLLVPFTGPVCLELYSVEALEASLSCLNRAIFPFPGPADRPGGPGRHPG